ncbi:hypothetical protein b3_0048 [Synechococcus phage B3]|nr:hypothetical protein b3_0048 [Synechococcus phage B3]QGT54676.1 hypothetical protein b23_0048 [Synechococcus phage B23]
MKVHTTELVKKILANPSAQKQLQQALTNPNQCIEIDGKIYELVKV